MQNVLSAKTVSLLKAVFAIDADGNTYIRMAHQQQPKDLENAVKTQSTRSLETLLQRAIVLDSSGQPALNVAVVDYGGGMFAAQKIRQAENAKEVNKVKEKALSKHQGPEKDIDPKEDKNE